MQSITTLSMKEKDGLVNMVDWRCIDAVIGAYAKLLSIAYSEVKRSRRSSAKSIHQSRSTYLYLLQNSWWLWVKACDSQESMDHVGATNQWTNLQTIRQKETNSKKMRVYDHIIQQLVVRRNELGISQRTLDYEIGCADGLVGKWERKKRRPSAFMLSCWVEALNCEIIIKAKQ